MIIEIEDGAFMDNGRVCHVLQRSPTVPRKWTSGKMHVDLMLTTNSRLLTGCIW